MKNALLAVPGASAFLVSVVGNAVLVAAAAVVLVGVLDGVLVGGVLVGVFLLGCSC